MKKYLLSAVSLLLMITATAQWQNQNAGFTNDTLGFYEMSLPNKHTAWAVCYDGKNGLGSGRLVLDFTRTTNGGTTWRPGKMGTDISLEFSNISALSEKEAWVAMHKRGGITGGGLYHTKDGGNTWRQSNAGLIFDNNSFPNFVHFKDKNHGVAMGDPNAGYFEIYTTKNGGNTWKRVTVAHMPATLPGEYGFISGFSAVGNTIWFGTTLGRIWKSTNFGKDWAAYIADPSGKFVNEIAFNDDKLHGVAHLRDNNYQTFLYSTFDGGITWTNLGQPANWKSSRITSVPGTNALVATSVNGFDFGSSLSYDNGTTWTIIESTAPKAVCRFFDRHTGYAGGFFITGPPFSPGIYKSTIEFQTPSQHNNCRELPKSISPASVSVTTATTSVYPSPASDVIYIKLQDGLVNAASKIAIVSLDGRLMQSLTSKGRSTIQLDVSKLVAGIYMVRIEANGQVVNKTIAVAR